MQITAFHIKAGDQKSELYSTVYDFTITIQQVREGTRILFAGHFFQKKVQKLIGAKESGKILGEKVKEGYKQYELHATVPVQGASESQLKSLETYYENYDLKILNSKQEKIGVFQNIIQIVKDYGEKMNLQR